MPKAQRGCFAKAVEGAVKASKLSKKGLKTASASLINKITNENHIPRPQKIRDLATELRSDSVAWLKLAEEQRQLITSQQALCHNLLPIGRTVLPKNHWPSLSVWIDRQRLPERLPLKAFVPLTGTCDVKVIDLGVAWSAPSGFRGYNTFANRLWADINRARVQEGKSPLDDNPKWHVDSFRFKPNSECPQQIDLFVRRTSYRHVVATSREGSLDLPVDLADGTTRTVKEWLAATWLEKSPERPYPSGANSLTVNLLVTTSDGKTLVSRQGVGNFMSKGIWVASVSGQISPGFDLDGTMPSPIKAARRECGEEIGERNAAAIRDIQWLGAVVRLDFGWFALLGEAKLNLTSEQVAENFSRHDDKSEVERIDFVTISAQPILDILKRKNCGIVLPLHLALLLKQRSPGSVKISGG